MSIEQRKSYCEHDAHLVAELVRIRNGNILRIMQIIATHTGLSFEEVCHKGMSGIWKKMFDNKIRKKINTSGNKSVPLVLRNLYYEESVYSAKYFEYLEDEIDEDLLDYKENSFDDCVEVLEQRIKQREVNSTFVNDYSHNGQSNTIRKDKALRVEKSGRKFKGDTLKEFIHLEEKGSNRYWLCNRRKGLFSTILRDLTNKRLQYKKDGKELESLAMKIIINSGYGVFGFPKFKYYDPSVAEIVTALGRQTLLKIEEVAKEMKFTVLYGDSDSIFCNNIQNKQEIDTFRDKCKQELNVEVNHEKTFKKLILVSKKHYVGIPYDLNKDAVIKGMEGIKSDRPEFIHSTFIKMIDDMKKDISPIPNLKNAFAQLDKRQVPKEKLTLHITLRKDPSDYTNFRIQKRLGSKNKLAKGDILTYYKCDKDELTTDQFGKRKILHINESDDPNDISYARYKDMLLTCVRDVIEILGYDVDIDLLSKRKLIQMSLF